MTQKGVARSSLVLALSLIGALTLLPQRGFPDGPFDWCVVCGSYGTTNLVLNALLYLPLGAALRKNGATLPAAFVISLTLCTAIEIVQLLWIPGRHSSLADIISNTGGGALGWLALGTIPKLLRPHARTASILAPLHLSAITLLTLCGGLIYKPSPTNPPWFGQIAQTSRERPGVQGIIRDALLNGDSLPGHQLDESRTAQTRALLNDRKLNLSATVVVLNYSQRQASVLRIADADGEEIAMLGAVRRDALFTVRTRATDLRLREPILVAPGALDCMACDARRPIQIAGRIAGSRYEIDVRSDARRVQSSLAVTPSLIWVAFAPWSLGAAPVQPFVSLIYMFLLWSAAAYWGVFHPRAGRSWWVLGSTMAGAIILNTVLLPLLLVGEGEGASIVGAALLGAVGGAIAGRSALRTGNPIPIVRE